MLTGLFAVLLLVLLGCGALFAKEAPPPDPLSSNMTEYDTGAAIVQCDSERNDKVYIPASVAVEQSETEKPDTGNEDEPEEEEEPEEPEEEEEEQPQEQQQQQIQVPAARTAPDSSGGTSAGSDTPGSGENGSQTDDTVYFTTSICDGETVTSSTYAFTITHKIKKLTVKEEKVLVNGTQVPQFNGKVELKEGENTIRIIVTYLDETGKPMNPVAKSYTVKLDSTSLVISTTLKNETVDTDIIDFTAYASYLGDAAELTVTKNGKEIKGNDTRYEERLADGENVFVLTAKGGNLTKSETYTVICQNSGDFQIGTTLKNQTVSESEITFRAWIRNASSDEAILTVKVNGTKISGNGEYYTAHLNNGDNNIRISAGEGENYKTLDFTVTYERPKAGPGNPNPDPEHAPQITVNVKDGDTTAAGRFTLKVTATSWNGKTLYNDNLIVKLNDVTIPVFAGGNISTYTLNLREGPNTISVYAEDNDGYSAYYSYTLTYEPTEGAIGYATISVEATTLGLGYIIPPTKIEIYNNEPISYALDRLFTQYGMTYDHDGTMDDGFYLQRIYKDGITSGWKIPDKLQEYLDADGQLAMGDPEDNSLGEFDVYNRSGWMVAVNGTYPNYGFSSIYMTDGEVCTIRFTLALGKDIGGGDVGGTSANYPESFVEQ